MIPIIKIRRHEMASSYWNVPLHTEEIAHETRDLCSTWIYIYIYITSSLTLVKSIQDGQVYETHLQHLLQVLTSYFVIMVIRLLSWWLRKDFFSESIEPFINIMAETKRWHLLGWSFHCCRQAPGAQYNNSRCWYEVSPSCVSSLDLLRHRIRCLVRTMTLH